ncbi:MAG: DUF554 domain-containing protein [Butyricicoccus sp.]|nr:DUF554 domain-containing protein [Butyricicoccus sp.]
MLGTIVNTGAILCGSLIGGTLRKGLREDWQEAMIRAMGLAATALGVSTISKNMPDSVYPVLFIVGLGLGSVVGTALKLEERFTGFADRHSKTKLGKGLSTAVLMFCIGTLSILGPIESALRGDNTFLFTNATLDFITSMALAASYGYGIAFAAPILFCWQGAIYLGAGALSEFLSGGLLTEISILGGILIFSSGISILKIRDCKTMNLLPSLLVPPIWFALVSIFT